MKECAELDQEEQEKKLNVKDVINGEHFGIQNVKRISIMLDAVSAHQTVQLVWLISGFPVQSCTMIEVMENLWFVSKDGYRVELFVTHHVKMELKDTVQFAGDNVQQELLSAELYV